MFKNIVNRLKRASSKKLAVGTAFAVALVAAASLGFATKQFTSAAIVKDCDDNAIMRCGADDNAKFISNVKTNNKAVKTQTDLAGLYDHYGLSASDYARFQSTAQAGTVYSDGTVKVNNQTVLTGAISMGRQSFGNPARKATVVNGKTYYSSPLKTSLAKGVSSLPVMVMFDAKGQVEFIAMNACGNPVWGTKTTPEYSCKMLNQKAVTGQTNTYEYTTTLGALKNTSLNKLVYDFGDGSDKVTTTSATQVVKHTFTKSSTVTVTAYFNLPGKQVVAATVVADCKKAVKVTPPPAPFYACVTLTAVAKNEDKTEFRVTLKTNQGNGATLKDADFTYDGSVTTTGVVTKDTDGNIYKDFTVAKDGKQHKVSAKANFNVASAVQSKTCEVTFEAGKTPMCTVPGKESFPADSPECAYCTVPGHENLPKDSDQCYERCEVPGHETLPKNSPDCAYCAVEGKQDLPKDSTECVTPPEECKPGIPVGDSRCVDVPVELPHTGIGGAFGLFSGVTAVGAVAHRAFMSRRRK
jgi:hypothetical protein